jgi:glutaredoxin
LLVVAAALPAFAQYKVVGPDGKVSYTDRAPVPGAGTVTAMGGKREALVSETPLPAELRPVVARYPVTLYVPASNCTPCDGARQLLRQRGIPHREKLLASQEDGAALQRLTGSRDVPALTIGAQALVGLSPDTWTSYLDLAGYPKTSLLPADYRYPAATPMTEPRDITSTEPAARPQPPVAATPAPVNEPTSTPQIRF